MNKFFIITIILFTTVSCIKYDGKGLTTYSVKGRFKNGFWNCNKIVDLNSQNEVKIPNFSCILDNSKIFGKVYSDYYFSTGKDTSYTKFSYDVSFSNNNDRITFTPSSNDSLKTLEFKINSLTWNEMILESKITNKIYYFDKYITSNVNRPNIRYSYIEDKTFKFPGFE